jgi:hypothetical protein
MIKSLSASFVNLFASRETQIMFALVMQEIQAGELAVTYQNFAICVEMFFAAFAHLYAFPYDVYKTSESSSARSQVSANLRQVSLIDRESSQTNRYVCPNV